MIVEIFELRDSYHKSSGKFSISSISSCWRKKYMELKGLYTEQYDAKTIRTFAVGDVFHRLAVGEIMEKGQKLGLYVISSEINIPSHQYFSGRVDLILSVASTGELIIIDVKSCGNFTFNQVKGGECPEQYIKQVQLYLHFFKLKRGIILFYNKEKATVVEYEVKYDKTVCEKLIKEVEDFFKNYVEKNIEPQKCEGGDWGCECCGIGGKFK